MLSACCVSAWDFRANPVPVRVVQAELRLPFGRVQPLYQEAARAVRFVNHRLEGPRQEGRPQHARPALG
jgi:hypothetical protein